MESSTRASTGSFWDKSKTKEIISVYNPTLLFSADDHDKTIQTRVSEL